MQSKAEKNLNEKIKKFDNSLDEYAKTNLEMVVAEELIGMTLENRIEIVKDTIYQWMWEKSEKDIIDDLQSIKNDIETKENRLKKIDGQEKEKLESEINKLKKEEAKKESFKKDCPQIAKKIYLNKIQKIIKDNNLFDNELKEIINRYIENITNDSFFIKTSNVPAHLKELDLARGYRMAYEVEDARMDFVDAINGINKYIEKNGDTDGNIVKNKNDSIDHARYRYIEEEHLKDNSHLFSFSEDDLDNTGLIEYKRETKAGLEYFCEILSNNIKQTMSGVNISFTDEELKKLSEKVNSKTIDDKVDNNINTVDRKKNNIDYTVEGRLECYVAKVKQNYMGKNGDITGDLNFDKEAKRTNFLKEFMDERKIKKQEKGEQIIFQDEKDSNALMEKRDKEIAEFKSELKKYDVDIKDFNVAVSHESIRNKIEKNINVIRGYTMDLGEAIEGEKTFESVFEPILDTVNSKEIKKGKVTINNFFKDEKIANFIQSVVETEKNLADLTEKNGSLNNKKEHAIREFENGGVEKTAQEKIKLEIKRDKEIKELEEGNGIDEREFRKYSEHKKYITDKSKLEIAINKNRNRYDNMPDGDAADALASQIDEDQAKLDNIEKNLANTEKVFEKVKKEISEKTAIIENEYKFDSKKIDDVLISVENNLREEYGEVLDLSKAMENKMKELPDDLQEKYKKFSVIPDDLGNKKLNALIKEGKELESELLKKAQEKGIEFKFDEDVDKEIKKLREKLPDTYRMKNSSFGQIDINTIKDSKIKRIVEEGKKLEYKRGEERMKGGIEFTGPDAVEKQIKFEVNLHKEYLESPSNPNKKDAINKNIIKKIDIKYEEQSNLEAKMDKNKQCMNDYLYGKLMEYSNKVIEYRKETVKESAVIEKDIKEELLNKLDEFKTNNNEKYNVVRDIKFNRGIMAKTTDAEEKAIADFANAVAEGIGKISLPSDKRFSLKNSDSKEVEKIINMAEEKNTISEVNKEKKVNKTNEILRSRMVDSKELL